MIKRRAEERRRQKASQQEGTRPGWEQLPGLRLDQESGLLNLVFILGDFFLTIHSHTCGSVCMWPHPPAKRWEEPSIDRQFQSTFGDESMVVLK